MVKCKETLAEAVKDIGGFIRHGIETLESTGQGFGKGEFQKWDNGRTNPFLLSSPPPSLPSMGSCPLLFPFKFTASFPLIIMTAYMYVCIHKYINPSLRVHLMLLVCI